MISDRKIRAYALKNAVSHDGIAMQGPVISSLFSEGLKKRDIKTYAKKINEIILGVNNLSKEEQKKEFEKIENELSEREQREGLPELPNAKKGKVIMRFSPSPSGPMHIGHASTGMPSALYVQKYGGKFILRIEDTNPENIYAPAYKMLKEEAEWLFGKFCKISKISIQSDRMKIYYSYVEKLIKKKSAYVCTCGQEKFKELIDVQKECVCRKNDVKENLRRWKWMLSKKGYNEGEAVLRFKSDVKHKNPAMRDFPLARINFAKHPRQGNKYRVWPLMNLAVAVDDIEEKITHSIRAKDHKDNSERQKMIFKSLGKEKKFPWTAFLGRLNFTDMEISASKTRKAIEEGKYSGWDDPNLPFIASLKKRGYRPEAFAKMTIERGISEVDKVISKEDYFELLDKFNKMN